jgi:hypothetical protein
MKITRGVLLACVVCLAGGGVAGIPGARADDCGLASAAAIAQAKVPHAVTHVTAALGKPPTRVEMIFMNDKAYTQMNGAWNSIAYSAQQQIDAVDEASKRAEQTVHTCEKRGGEAINGEAASLLIVHSEATGKVSESRAWVSDKTGLPLKSEVHLSNGTVVTDDFRYGNIEAPPGVK